MAAEALPPSSRIDQTVHGYDRGHRLLAASCTFDDAADQLLGSMSDLLTTQLLEGGNSYLVGYPLKSKNGFVLARTWAAHEMPRPGSVWTHSLIIDYQTLAMLEDPGRLLGLLRRPDMRTIDSFAAPILQIPVVPLKGATIEASAAWTAISSLYGRPSARITALTSMSAPDDEHLVVAIWRQMWPAIRRDTAFFSFSGEPPPSVDASCIIRFVSRTGTVSVTGDSDIQATELLVRDLPETSRTPMRKFLALHAFDAPEPRAAVLPLVRLWEAMGESDQVTIVAALVDAMPYANAVRLVRSVLGQILKDVSEGSPLLQIVEQFGDLEVPPQSGWLTSPVSWSKLDDLGTLLDRSANYPVGTLAAAIFNTLATTSQIADLAQARYTDSTAARLLDHRPELLDQRAFWETRKSTRPVIIRIAAAFGRPLENVLDLVSEDLTTEGIAALFEGWPDQVGVLIENLTGSAAAQRQVGAVLGRRPALLLHALEARVALMPNVVDEAVAQAFKDYGFAYPPREPWHSLAVLAEESVLPNLVVLSFAHALSGTGNSRMTIARLFSPLMQMANRNALSYDARRYLETAFRSRRIYRWSITDALYEALISAFLDGREVSVAILSAVDHNEITGLVETLYAKSGLGSVKNLKARAQNCGSFNSRIINCMDDFIRSKEKKWLW